MAGVAFVGGCESSRPVTGTDGGAGADAHVEADAGPTGPDEDGDGIAAASDCDDTNADIGETSSRACYNVCENLGEQVCERGAWGECGGGVLDCLCPTVGEMRVAPCGFCGQWTQRCGTSGFWEATSSCMMQGECAAGSAEHETDELCLDRERICDATCHWTDWTVHHARGECVAGSRRTVPVPTHCGEGYYECDANCIWQSTGEMLDPDRECIAGETYFCDQGLPFPEAYYCNANCRREPCP